MCLISFWVTEFLVLNMKNICLGVGISTDVLIRFDSDSQDLNLIRYSILHFRFNEFLLAPPQKI